MSKRQYLLSYAVIWLLCCLPWTSSAVNRLEVEDLCILAGQSKQVPIALINDTAFTACQMDIHLPDALSMQNANGDFSITLSSRFSSSHIITANRVSNGSIRVVIYSLSNAAISGNAGDLLYLNITALSSFNEVSQIQIDNIRFTSTNVREHVLSSVTCFAFNFTLETITANDSCIWHGHTYYESGRFFDTLQNVLGADSIVVLNLTIPNYTISFRNYDGTMLHSSLVATGDMPQYPGTIPTKPANAQYSYVFSSWLPVLAPATRTATYTAGFDSIVNQYVIVFADEDGTELQRDTLAYGSTPVAPADPAKAATAQYTYAFAGWSPTIETVMGDATYTATYSSTVNQYAITFENYDGTVLQSSNVAYGDMPQYLGETPIKAATAQYTYAFAGWSPTIGTVTGDATYTAVFDSIINQYAITFENYDGTVLQVVHVDYETFPIYPGETPTRPSTLEYSYIFSGWMPDLVAVTGEASYRATFDSVVNNYVIVFADAYGMEYQRDTLAYGSMPVAPADPAKAATAQYTYAFAGWTPTIETVTGDATYTAVFDSIINQYVIVFADEDGTELKRDTLDYGSIPVAPADPAKAATAQYTYAFAGWSPAVALVTGDATYTATYSSTINKYLIIFQLDNGIVLKFDSIDYGTIPSFDYEVPDSIHTAQYTYIFCGWTPEPVAVTQDAVYTAVIDSVINQYTLTLSAENGTVSGGGTFDYGTELTITATPDDGYEFTKWSDDNTDNPRTIILVKDLFLEAYFKEVPNALDKVESSDSNVQKIYRDGHFFVIRENQVFDFTGKKVE